MSTRSDIANLTKEIEQLEIRLRTIEAEIYGLDKQLELLNLLEASLKENIHLLKQQKIITLAFEFKRAKVDLEKTHKRKIHLIEEKNMMVKAYSITHKNLSDLRESYIELMTPSNNVIQIKTGKKNE